jgi:hypothetical protein
LSRFPVVFRLPAFSSRVILSPLGDWASLAVGLPGSARTPSGFHVPHARVATGEGALSTPRTAVLTRPIASLRPPPAASQRQRPCTPVEHPSSGAQLDGASSRVHWIHPADLPRPVTPGWNGSPWASPPSSTPCRGQLRRYRRRTSGWGLALSTGLGQRSRRHRSTLLSTSPRTRIVRPRVAPRDSCMRPERIRHNGAPPTWRYTGDQCRPPSKFVSCNCGLCLT